MIVTCPHCGSPNDVHPTDETYPPSSGNVVICSSCHDVAIFTDRLDLRRPAPAENPDITAALLVLRHRRAREPLV